MYRRPVSHTNLYGEKQRHTSFQRNNPKICRCVPKLNELYALYHFRVRITKLTGYGSQCVHLKNCHQSTFTYKFWWGGTSSEYATFPISMWINNTVLLS